MKKGVFLLLCLSLQLGIIAQNTGWILPPLYKPNMLNQVPPVPLPTQNPSIGYDGLPATNASNAMQDANGDLLFFIVDDMIYDKEGYRIGMLTIPNNGINLYGTAEITIVPVPDNCSQFYIFLAGSNNYDLVHSKAFVAKLDMSLPTDVSANSGRLGLVLFCENIQQYIPSEFPDISHPERSSSIFFAASKLRDDNTRFVFFTGYKGLYRFKVSASNLQFDNYWSFIPTYTNENTGQQQRGEMELIELPGEGPEKYRLAVALKLNVLNSNTQVSQSVLCLDLNSSGDVISEELLSYLDFPNLPSNQVQPYIHGLEFSPNGSILYISHSTNKFYTNAFDYYDFNSPSSGIQAVPGISQSQSTALQYSQMEIGKLGKLYLAHSNGLASFTNPNTPSTGVFNMIDVPFTYNFNMQNASYYSEGLKSYMLPDQIDGMDYSSIGYPSIYTVAGYTAGTSATWQPIPNQNPWGVSNSDIAMQGDLIIPSGKNVVIKNMTFRFAPDAKVIIEQGAKLTLDRAVFTNMKLACDNSEGYYWQGVEVYGTSNLHQFPVNNPTHQGMLELKNGGTIENAHLAFTNWNPQSWSEIGGVIKSTDGVFRNNRRGVEFMAYQNFTPNYPGYFRNNTSSFTDTEFLTNDDFVEGYPQQPYVTLWKVHGIDFKNCHFSNNVTTNKSLSSSPNEGISSLDASFRVIPRCDSPPLPYGTPCPTGLLMKSSFDGLEYAIQVAGAGVTEAVTISQTDFTNNIWGIRVKEFDNVNINRNNFVIGDGGYNSSTYSGNGIYLQNSAEYIVEENSVQNNLISGKTSGIVVDNGGPSDNRLYKNSLNNLFEGTKSNRINRSKYAKNGLQFLCNEYVNNDNAILINSSHNSHGVRQNQGDYYPQTSAGNTFQFNTLDIANYANQIKYYHSGGITMPNMTNGVVGPVNEVLLEVSNSCLSNFKPGVLILDQRTTELADFETELVSHEAAYNNLYYNYISLIDNGNTDILQSQIENNWSSDAWTLRNNLMQEAPYLSTEALLTAAGENILPNAMLLEVLLANPDATKGEQFIFELNDVTNNALPEYMLNYVRNNWNTETVRTSLEGEIMAYQSKIAEATHFIKYLKKSKEEHTYSERHNIVLMGEGISNKIGVMDFFIENSEWSRADSVLQAINSDESMQADIGLIEDFDNYITFRSSLGSRNIAQLDSTEVQYLETLAEKGNRASGYAENILCFFYDICFEKEVPEGGGMAKMLTIPAPSGNEPTLEELMYNITVYPNPASEFTSIKWEIYDELENAQYKIYDMNGREIGTGSIEENTGEKLIDTRNLENGVYIVNIYNDGIMKMNSKLIVSKEK
ncbi:T9SS type A sorting domain-containing protein [Brumimicrobium oceani]|uniref:Secretion system C-terminal sorting domain-containing protein n=1 Tax=Brumimicrobium oceani TaxID=2100725 RepID=A0A2U2XD94_9FLAO|nr:T9SS type A sorting domain-containing protein [Brumimicrobium oceani]PWH85764.1 hypothetical protein DIT68_06635 [Brumimicrobium oceani]